MRYMVSDALASLCLVVTLTGCGGGSPSAAKAEVAGATLQALSIVNEGSGSVSSSSGVNCAQPACTANVADGALVTLAAQPMSGWTFTGWDGACAGAATCTITMDQARSVKAIFALAPLVSPLVSGGCDLARSTGSTAAYAAHHPKVLLNHAPTLSCLQQLLSSNAAAAQRFKSYVDSEIAQPGRNWGFQHWWAALMYQSSGASSYADFAINQVDAWVSSEEARIAAGQTPVVAGDSYLDVGGVMANVALTYDWCYDRLTTTQRARWIAYMNQSVWNVWHADQASWGGQSKPWSGWSVNNPSNNYYYSFLRATMLVGLATRGDHASAQGWIDQFRTAKVANELVPTFNRDLAGGGSREGTGYGTSMKGLFQLYDWWERSTGERIATLTPHTLASQAWLVHSIVPTLDFLVATGDQARDSSAALFDYHREYLLSLISLFPQERLSTVTKGLLDASSVPTMQNGFEFFADYLYQPPALPQAAISDLSTAYWGSGTGQLMMRSSWGDKGAAYANLVCGPFTESHAHRDQGSFQLYRGEWLAPTGNIYTHSGIEQQEELNNLVRIENQGSTVRQVNGSAPCEMVALADNDHYTYGVARITPVYNGHAAISKVEREYLFIKPATFVVFDRVASVSGSRRIWTLNLPGAPVLNGNRLTYTGAKSNVLDVYRVAPTGLSYQVSTPVLLEPQDTLLNAAARRVDVVDTAGTQSNFLHVLGTNASVGSVARSDVTGQTGVQITLVDGRVVTARFANGSTGGSLDIRQASGTVEISGVLPTTVSPPPLFRR